MPKENRILSLVQYGLKNNSNFDLTEIETRDIVDIPYFPLQNLVDFTGDLNPYNPQPQWWIPFMKEVETEDGTQKEYHIYGMVYRPDARYIFLDLGNNYRKWVYRFNGDAYPQSRTEYAITYNGKDKLFIFGGYYNGRTHNDFWVYDFNNNEWKHLDFSVLEKTANKFPTTRRKASLYYNEEIDELFVFGGITDVFVSLGDRFGELILNDVWAIKFYDVGDWDAVSYDPYSKLPHRLGVITYADQEEIHILIKGGVKEGSITGELEKTKLFIIKRDTGDIWKEVEFDNDPIPIEPDNIISARFYGENYIYCKSNRTLYTYTFDHQNDQYQFTVKKSDVDGVYNDNAYFVVYPNQKFAGLFKDYRKNSVETNYDSEDLCSLYKYITGATDCDGLTEEDLSRFYKLLVSKHKLVDNIIEGDVIKLDTDEIIETKKIWIPPILYQPEIVHIWEGVGDITQTSKFVWITGLYEVPSDQLSDTTTTTTTNADNNKVYGIIEKQFVWDGLTKNLERILVFGEEERPTERIYPALTYDKYNKRIWLFGGSNGKFFNDLWYLDTQTWTWHLVETGIDNITENSELVDYPQPRYKAGIVVVLNNYLYLVGGYNDIQTFYDMWQYNIETRKWEKITLLDVLPIGTAYKIFEWKDRLWLFNGEPDGIYRFFYSKKVFVKQPLKYIAISKTLSDLIEQKGYLGTPIGIDVLGTNMFVYGRHPSSKNTYITFVVDLEQKVLHQWNTEVEGGGIITENTLWVSPTEGFINLGYYAKTLKYISVFYNVSKAYPLSRNHLPHHIFIYNQYQPNENGEQFMSCVCEPYKNFINVGKYLTQFVINLGENVDYINGVIGYYVDRAGFYEIQAEKEFLDKQKLYEEGRLGVAISNTDTEDKETKLNNILSNPAILTYRPIFYYDTYSNIYQYKYLKGAIEIFQRKKDKLGRFYVLYNNGNIVRYNLRDGTQFRYYTDLWDYTAIGYDSEEDRLYAFGGIVQLYRTCIPCDTSISKEYFSVKGREVYKQNGVPFNFGGEGLLSHNGFFNIDFLLNQFTTEGILNFNKRNFAQVVDYDKVKLFATDLVKGYTEKLGVILGKEYFDKVLEKTFVSVKAIIDTLSQITITYEDGERPTPRWLHQYWSIDGDGLYVVGGAECILYTECCKDNGSKKSLLSAFPIGYSRYSKQINQLVKTNKLSDAQQLVEQYRKENLRLYKFDYKQKKWIDTGVDLPPIVDMLYGASTIVSPDKKKVYIVGGYIGSNFQMPNPFIFVYDIEQQKFDYYRIYLDEYEPALFPTLTWIDEHRLIIQYGYVLPNSKCEWKRTLENTNLGIYVLENYKEDNYDDFVKKMANSTADKLELQLIDTNANFEKHKPLNKAYIFDTRTGAFYLAWEKFPLVGGIAVADFLHKESESRELFIIYPFPVVDYEYDPVRKICVHKPKLYAERINLLTGEHKLEKYDIGDTEIIYDLVGGQENINDFDTQYLGTKAEFYFRYAWVEVDPATNHRIIYIVGERHTGKRIDLRFWFIDVDDPQPERRKLWQIPYEYPIADIPFVACTYDGARYLYIIWNKYNIWRLDFKGVLTNPEGSHWFRLPPCLNCDFLEKYSDLATNSVNAVSYNLSADWLPPNYVILLSPDGLYAKLDVLRYSWHIKKLNYDTQLGIYTQYSGSILNLFNLDDIAKYLEVFDNPLNGKPPKLTTYAIDKDTYDWYVFTLGSIFGKVQNLYHNQWDWFYFDLTPFTYTAYIYGGFVDNRLFPVVIKRRRLYLYNHIGTVWYSWVRVRGKLDITYSPNEFYDVDEIRIYTDQYGLAYKDSWEVSIYTIDGEWIDIPKDKMEVVINDNNWDWDWRFRRYYKIYITDDGLIGKSYTKCPPNYIRIKLKEKQDDGTYNVIITDKPISFIRVKFAVPIEDETNKVVHLNRVETIKYEDKVGVVESPTSENALDIVYFEPITTDELETQVYQFYVKNLSDKPMYDVKVWINNNHSFLLSKDGNEWKYHDKDNPLKVADVLQPNEVASFLIKGVNVDDMPKDGLMVVVGRGG